MEVIITALGPDNVGLADPIIHHVTGRGARIAEIQMYDHDEEHIFAMLCRIDIEADEFEPLTDAMRQIGQHTSLAIRVWSSENREKRPRIAVCCTYVEHTPRAVLEAIQSDLISAETAVLISNRDKLGTLADEFNIPFRMIGNDRGVADDDAMTQILDEFDVDYVVLARYMRILSPNFVWRYPNRIINIHPSLLPAFPGALAYAQAYERGTKIVGVTSHYVTENLDQGPIIFQDSFKVDPNDTLEKIKSKGQKLEADTLLKATKMHLENKLEVRWRKVHIKSK